jgi:hypothetical protein
MVEVSMLTKHFSPMTPASDQGYIDVVRAVRSFRHRRQTTFQRYPPVYPRFRESSLKSEDPIERTIKEDCVYKR